MSDVKTIAGAGLAGMLAACKWTEANIYDPNIGDPNFGHAGVLRFKDDSVSRLTGIPFKLVKIRKSVLRNNELYDEATIKDQNQYSFKVTGGLHSRSIGSLGADQRYIAPEDFHKQLLQRFQNRIINDVLDFIPLSTTVSTIPLPVMLRITGVAIDDDIRPAVNPEGKQIIAAEFELDLPSDVYQTVYIPSPDTSVYRMTIHGDKLIVECADYMEDGPTILMLFSMAFGLSRGYVGHEISRKEKPRGKIIDLPQEVRHRVLHMLSSEFGVYSVGRFACWRNILLDDVVKDIEKVDRLITFDEYSRRKAIV